MSAVKAGDTVAIHYKGTLKDGSVFDSSEGRDPLSFTVGSGEIIPGLDQALPGMTAGDTKRVEVPCDAAYGPRIEEARQEVARSDLPDTIPLDEGVQLQARNEAGEVINLRIAEVGETHVVLDANHPLAGEDLIFDIELVSVG